MPNIVVKMRYLSTSKGVGGEIKKSPEDFVVKEITKTGKILEPNMTYSAADLEMEVDEQGKFTVFVLQKKDWSTIQALQNIAKRMGRGVRSIGYAGMKDKIATTTQLASIFGTTAQATANVKLKDTSINGAWQSKQGIGLGDLIGNDFEIKIMDCKETQNIPKIFEELDGKIPNYFDAQRFGNRLNNAKVGALILQNRLEEAAIEFLTGTANETNQTAVEARTKLREERNFEEALNYFPGYLRQERTMIYHLSKNPTDFAKALRSIPRGISILFIHALEAAIFNYATELKVKENSLQEANVYCGIDVFGFPDLTKIGQEDEKKIPLSTIIGYQTKEEEISEYERQVLDMIGIKKEDFKISSMPELSMKGTYRPIFAPFKEAKYELFDESANVSFALPSGAYATILLGEITKKDSLDIEGMANSLKAQ